MSLLRLLGLRRKQALRGNLEPPRQREKLIVNHAAQLRLNLGQSPTTDVQSAQLALGGKLLLRQPKLIPPLADLRPDYVGGCFGSGHALEKSNLTLTPSWPSNCYAFLATGDSDGDKSRTSHRFPTGRHTRIQRNTAPSVRRCCDSQISETNMKAATRNSNISLSILLCAVTLPALTLAGFAQPQYV